MRSCWIFGSSKALGSSLTEALRVHHRVTCFSRTVPGSAPDTVAIDFSDLESTQRMIAEFFELLPPDGAVFCQRYRPEGTELSDLEALKAGLDVELAPVLALMGAAQSSVSPRPLSIILISSVAGASAHLDVPLYYHLLKAITLSATRTLAAQGAANSLRVNCIVLGEFQKYPRETYTCGEQEKYNRLGDFALSGRICNISDIVGVIEFLLSDQSSYLTGQVLHIDGGISGIAPESILRVMLAGGRGGL